MSSARFIIGDTREVLRSLPAGSVDLLLTSPPFLALRSYLPDDDPGKPLEIGQEPNPGAFIDALLDVVVEARRVLAPHATLAVELGDTYAGSGGAGGDYSDGGMRAGQPAYAGSAKTARSTGDGWPLRKSLCLVPELFRIALVYGVNPLTGRTLQRWRARNVVRWCRPNPPVGALGDKFRPATSDLVIACVSDRRYFDLDAVREPSRGGADGETAPPLDWWEVSPESYEGSHYAVWPRKLLTRPVLALTPERVCLECGEPSRRIVEATRRSEPDDSSRRTKAGEYRLNGHDHPPEVGWEMDRVTVGWTDCGHGAWRRGVVLDPFGGSGTTLEVATGHGRDAIGIDLDERNAELARERVGMFLELEDRRPAVAVVAGS